MVKGVAIVYEADVDVGIIKRLDTFDNSVTELLNAHSFSAVLIQIDIEVEYRVGDVGVINSVVQRFNVELLKTLVVCISRHRTCIVQWWLSLLLAFPLQDYGTSPLMSR